MEQKCAARATWAACDYASVAERELWPLRERTVAHAGVCAGEEVPDGAYRKGNAAIRAAQAGGRVGGGDLTSELLATAPPASEAGVGATWV